MKLFALLGPVLFAALIVVMVWSDQRKGNMTLRKWAVAAGCLFSVGFGLLAATGH